MDGFRTVYLYRWEVWDGIKVYWTAVNFTQVKLLTVKAEGLLPFQIIFSYYGVP